MEFFEKRFVDEAVSETKGYLINSEGKIVFGTDYKPGDMKINPKDHTVILENFIFDRELRQALREKRLQFEAERDHKKYIFGISRVSLLDCNYVEQISEQELRKAHKQHKH